MTLSQWALLLQLVCLDMVKDVIGPLNECSDDTCVNGNCQYGICTCLPCYTGPSCQLLNNQSPKFEKSSYEFNLLQKPFVGKVLGKVSATDMDSDICLDNVCPCKIILYSIINDVNNGMFAIDKVTGEVSLTVNELKQEYEYSIDIKATNQNPFDNVYDTATIYVKYGLINVNVKADLERFKRAATAPSTLTFNLLQVYPTTPINISKISQKLSFTLTITFPVGLSTFTVELFGAEATSPVMMICNPVVSAVGSQVNSPPFPTAPLLEGITGGPAWPYTKATYNITNLNNLQASPNAIEDIQVVISFDAYMLYYPSILDATLYYVSAGAEYLNATQIWVGQSGYTSSVNVPTPAPTVTLTGDTAIYPGSTATFDLVIISTDHYIQLNMEFYSPFNDTTLMSFCYVNRYFMGDSFSCVPPTYMQPYLTNITSNLVTYYPTAIMNLSYVVNQLKLDATATGADKDTIKIKMALRTNPLAWPGITTYIGVAISTTATNIVSAVKSLPIVIKGPKTPYTSQIVAVLDYNNGNQVPIGTVQQLVIKITVPQNTELDYTIRASFASLNTEICGFTFLSAGANIPCLNQVPLKPTFALSSDGYQVYSNVTIANVRSVPISTKPSDDVIQYLISFRPINDSRNTAGSNIQSNIILMWNGAATSVLSNTFVLQAAPVLPNVLNSDVPTFQFYMIGSDGNVSTMQSRTMYFSMSLVPGIVYTPVTLQFYMPFNTTARMKICQASITFIGSNLICFSQTSVTNKFVYSSRVNDSTNYDTLTIPIGSLSTAGPSGRTATKEDTFIIQLDILILSHSMNVLNSQTTINAGMLITADKIWVGNQNINFITATVPPALVAPNIPTLTGSRVDSSTSIVWKNDLAIVQYIIKVAGGSTAQLSLSVTSDITTTDMFSICNIYVIQKGNSIPCIQTTTSYTTWTPFSKFKKTFTMQFSQIINSGNTPISNPSFDTNSILVEVPVKFGGTLPATFNVKATLTYNSATVNFNIPFTLQTTFSRINGTVLADEPIFAFNLMPLFNDSFVNVSVMGYGEAMRGSLSVQLKPATIQTLSFSFLSTPPSSMVMDVVSVNILSVGANIPCLQTGMMTYTITNRAGSTSSDLNTLNVGTVCRRDIIANSTESDNTIIVEVIFRVWRLPLNYPANIDINSLTLLNNDEIIIVRITINAGAVNAHIVETNLLTSSVIFNVSLPSTNIAINQNVTVNVTIFIPPYTQFNKGSIRVYSLMPAGADCPLVVSDNTNYTATFGRNVLFNSAENLRMSSTSTMNTTQLDNIILDLGITQNPGTTYRMGQENYTGPSLNDFITLQFNIRVTDNILAINSYAFTLIFGGQFGSQQINQSIGITVVRSNTEPISINATTTLLTNNTFYTQSNEVQVSTTAQLLNGSKLECRNFTIYVASPSFMTLTSVKNVSFTSPGIAVAQSTLALGGYSFNVPYFFLTDQISVIFGLTLKANTSLTRQRSQSLIVIPIIYACKTLNWPNPLGNTYINTPTDVRVTVQGNAVVIPGCNTDLQVWNSSAITDCSISSYLTPFAGFDALKVRSNSGAMWKPGIRGGYYTKFRYIDIVFGTLKTVVNVIVKSTHSNLPQEIAIYGTMDGRTYSYVSTQAVLFNGTIASVALSNPTFTYYGIRISVTKTQQNDQETGMNIDLSGCVNPNVTAPSIDPCPTSYTKPVTTLPNFYRRGYLYVAPNMFVCDDVPAKSTYLETYPRCYRTLDSTPTVWQDMGPYIGKVIGYDITIKAVYGIASDLKSYVMSLDDGVTYSSINQNGWIVTQAVGQLQLPVEIPWTVVTGFDATLTGTSCTAYVAGSWNFCYDGVYNSGTLQLSWNSCCAMS